MTTEKKKRVIIASVLKPVDDTRMFEKMAMTLDESGEYDVHVIGYPSSGNDQTHVKRHTFAPFRRLSLTRLFIPFKILKIILSLKPSLLIITTHELLIAAIVAKILTRCRVIYDVQENYFRNILYTDAFPKIIRPMLAAYVRLKEYATSVLIDHFFLAEKAYAHELRFLGKNTTVLENKVKRSSILPRRKHRDENLTLLFSGTLNENTGVFRAIGLARALHEISKNISLRIVGYASNGTTLSRIAHAIAPYPYISLVGGNELVPHPVIMNEIANADFGIIAYTLNPSTTGSVPTKLFEYLGAMLPVILVEHPPWTEVCEPCGAAIAMPDAPDQAFFRELTSRTFYTRAVDDIYWESEAEKLLKSLASLA